MSRLTNSLAIAIEAEYLFGNKQDGTVHMSILSAIEKATDVMEGSTTLTIHILRDDSVIVVDEHASHSRFKTVSEGPDSELYGMLIYQAIKSLKNQKEKP